MPTSKATSKAAFISHCRYSCRNHPVLHDFYGAVRFRNLNFSNYTGKQRALSKLCLQIINQAKDWYYLNIVVAFGGGRFSSSSRGQASGPIKQLFHQLRRRCVTKYVNEFRTSQVIAFFFLGIDGKIDSLMVFD